MTSLPSQRIWAISGDETGRVWRYHPTLDRLPDADGARWRCYTDDGSSAVLHRCEIRTHWDVELEVGRRTIKLTNEVERMRTAIALAREPSVRSCTTIRQLLDVHETEPEPNGESTAPGVLAEIWEWAAYGLDEWLRHDDREPGSSIIDEVAASVTGALQVLHTLGFVHCDVAPNNILLVDGTWKLGDLDSCVRLGEPVNRGPMAERKRYQHPDRRVGPVAARQEFDWWGLEQVLAKLRDS